MIRGRQGRSGEAEAIRAALEEQARTAYTPFLARAYAAEACGDRDAAFGLLEQAIGEREPLAVIDIADRRGNPLSRDDFRALLERMNLA